MVARRHRTWEAIESCNAASLPLIALERCAYSLLMSSQMDLTIGSDNPASV